jgi:alpha-1,2-mannosyltransferase
MVFSRDPMPSGASGDALPGRLHSRFLLLCCGVLIAAHLGFAAYGVWQGRFLVSEGGSAGYDFACFWGAGRLALHHQALAAYDWGHLKDVLDQEISFDADQLRPSLPFFYPPILLLIVAPLAALPFGGALAVWLVVTLAAYLAAIRLILPGPTALVTALAAPAVFFDMWVGQNGLLTAALLGGALALLDRRPVASGVLLGLLVYKPHFAILFPLVLGVTGRWRAFCSALATIALLCAITGLLFGGQIFATAAGALLSGSDYNLVSGSTSWFKVQSVYGTVRAAGLGSIPAWTLHGAVALAAVLATLRIWCGDHSYALKAATLSTAALLLPPYLRVYDLPLLAVPIAFLVRDSLERGFRPGERLALMLTLACGFGLTYLFSFLHQPIAIIVCAALAAIIARRVLPAGASAAEPSLAAS